MCIHHNFPWFSLYPYREIFSCTSNKLFIFSWLHAFIWFDLVYFPWFDWCTSHIFLIPVFMIYVFITYLYSLFLVDTQPYHSFGFKYFSSRNHISWCCFNSIPLLGLRNLMPHLSGTHRLPPFDRYRLIFLEIGVDFYISATDFLEIEIYYNKKKFFELFSLKKELSMGGLLHFRYRLPRDWNLLI